MIPQTNATEQIIDIIFKVAFHDESFISRQILSHFSEKNDMKLYGDFFFVSKMKYLSPHRKRNITRRDGIQTLVFEKYSKKINHVMAYARTQI